MRAMFRLWRLKWDRYWENARYEKQLRPLHSRHPQNRQEIAEVEHSHLNQLNYIDTDIEILLSDSVIQEARRLDVEIPRQRGEVDEDPNWEQSNFFGRVYLSTKGRSDLRRRVDEVKMRRFEVKTLWVTKFWLPLLAALVGIIGALTGLFAVLRHH